MILFVLMDAILLSLTLQKRTMYKIFFWLLTYWSNIFAPYIKNLVTYFEIMICFEFWPLWLKEVSKHCVWESLTKAGFIFFGSSSHCALAVNRVKTLSPDVKGCCAKANTKLQLFFGKKSAFRVAHIAMLTFSAIHCKCFLKTYIFLLFSLSKCRNN